MLKARVKSGERQKGGLGASALAAGFVLTLVLLAGCAARAERGRLEGHVTFTVSGAGASELPPLEKRSLIIYRSDGKTLVGNVMLDAQGNFALALDPGIYVVKWRRYKTETSNLPATVSLVSGQTVRLEVEVKE